MIDKPCYYVDDFIKAGSNIITVHVESSDDIRQAINTIKYAGVTAGISLKPKTDVSALEPFLFLVGLVLVMSVEPGFGGQKFMPSALDKIAELKKMRDIFGLSFAIQVDGGIDKETAPMVIKAGADILVAGSAVFGCSDYAQAIQLLRG
jgi:ribulose-phosphate 3-epimerase